MPGNAFRSTRPDDRFLNMLLEEVEKDFARKVADRVNKPANDPVYDQYASDVIKLRRYYFDKENIQDIKDGIFKST